jgi:hypothetical protein
MSIMVFGDKTAKIVLLLCAVLLIRVIDSGGRFYLVFGETGSYLPTTNRYLDHDRKLSFLFPAVLLGH